jgi:ABC-2 type transport system ATP-binding protein
MASQHGRDPGGRTGTSAGSSAAGAGTGTETGAGTGTGTGTGTRTRSDDAGTAGRGDPPALAVEGLSKTFGSGDDAVVAVDDVSLTVERGSVVGLLGPNGAGKTTIIRSILGTVLPDAGSVRVCGIDVHADPRAAYRHVDAMLEGARNDYWRLTVRENLRYFATVGGVAPDSVADRHDALLDRLGLAARADTPVRDLSRGMKQKVSLASVLATDADVVFLDEPTLGLDVESSLTLRRELRRIVADRDLTVVLSSHDMDVVEDVCDRVVVVGDGRVVADDSVERLLRGFDARGFRVTSRDLDEEALAAVRARFDVADVRSVDGRTRVEVATDSAGFYALTDLLRAHDVTLDAVDTVAPDLEDAFLEMTRDPEPEPEPAADTDAGRGAGEDRRADAGRRPGADAGRGAGEDRRRGPGDANRNGSAAGDGHGNGDGDGDGDGGDEGGAGGAGR